MRPIFLLAAIGLLCLFSFAVEKNSNQQRYSSSFESNENGSNDQQQKMRAPVFQMGREYQYKYNAQIASGLIAQDEQSQADAQQKAITRIQAQAKITFASESRGQLCLRRIRIGQLNEPVQNEQQVQPMSIFEPKQIPSDKRSLLERCCQFEYVDGVIQKIQFEQEDEAWSKNMKRGVLQMIQLNLKRNNAQGLQVENERQMGMDEEEQQQENEQQNGQQQQKDTLAMSFSIPEISVEEQCQTQNTSNMANPFQITVDVRFNRRGQRIVPEPVDQGVCGACWAISAALLHSAAVATRRGQNAVMFSAQYLVDCAPKSGDGCQGRPPLDAFERIEESGLATEAFYPYDTTASKSGICGTRAAQAIELTKQQGLLYKTTHYGKLNGASEMERYLRSERLPISAVFDAPIGFRDWKGSGVYSPTDEQCAEARKSGRMHVLTVIGYGSIEENEFWLVQNTYFFKDGSQWGEQNIGKFQKGKCAFEQNPYFERDVVPY